MDRLSLMFVVGTRPDAIKTAPVVREFQKSPNQMDICLASTGQHREMLDQALAAFSLSPDIDLAVMQHGQTLAEVTSRVLDGLDRTLQEVKPDLVFAQGDTTTTFVAALASFYRSVPFAHIEAGLRTESITNPFPEEFNRRAASLVASMHFPPTKWAAENLLREGAKADDVFVTGNTGIDAVMSVAKSNERDWYPEHAGRIVLLTTHRRENWGVPQERIAKAAREIVDKFPDVLLVVPMHRNPAVRETLSSTLRGVERVELIEPPDYGDFVKLMQRSTIVLTDSGGVQEEAPSFGVPVLVLRDTTERPEGVEAGTAKLVGTDMNRIIAETSTLLNDKATYEKMAHAVSPYGDGRASARIASFVFQRFGLPTEKVPAWA